MKRNCKICHEEFSPYGGQIVCKNNECKIINRRNVQTNQRSSSKENKKDYNSDYYNIEENKERNITYGRIYREGQYAAQNGKNKELFIKKLKLSIYKNFITAFERGYESFVNSRSKSK